MASEHVVIKKDNHVMSITLNRPDKRNALTFDMCYAVEKAVEDGALDRDIRVIVLRGEGKCFSAGIDLEALNQETVKYPTPSQARFNLGRLHDVYSKIEKVEKPVIALLHGYCFGMGTEMALAADFRIAVEGTKIGLQEVELGFIPDAGGTVRLTRTVGIPLAKEIIMSAKILEAEEACSIHLVNEVVPVEDLDAALDRWVEKFMGCAPLAVGLAKRIIDRGAHLDKLTFMEMEMYAYSNLINTEDVKEGVMARIQKRKPDFKGE